MSMRNKPIVSVVIPTYNHGRYLAQCLRSVLNQSFTVIEVIVIDNHSTDNTDEVLAQFTDERLKILKIHNNGVIAKSRNVGIENSCGEYIAFLDSDDWWKSEKLNRSIKALVAGAEMVYHDLFVVNQRDVISYNRRIKTRQVKRPVLYDLLIRGNAISTSSVVVKADLIRRIGGFSENKNIIAGEDYDAWIRLAKETELFIRINETLGFYWAGGGNMTTNERVKKYLEVIRAFYINCLPYKMQGMFNAQINYKISRSCYDNKEFVNAVKIAKKSIFMNSDIMIRLKLICIMLFSFMQIIVRGKAK